MLMLLERKDHFISGIDMIYTIPEKNTVKILRYFNGKYDRLIK
jgi:hypothetical protein